MRRKSPSRIPDGLSTTAPRLSVWRQQPIRWRRGKVNPMIENEWIVCYEKLGFTIQRIADEYGVSYSRIRRHLIDHKITIRPQGRHGLRLSPLMRISNLEEEIADLKQVILAIHRWQDEAERTILGKLNITETP